MKYAEQIMRLRQELLKAEDGDDSFAGCGNLRDCDTAEAWLERLRIKADAEHCPAGKVPSDTWLAVRISDEKKY